MTPYDKHIIQLAGCREWCSWKKEILKKKKNIERIASKRPHGLLFPSCPQVSVRGGTFSLPTCYADSLHQLTVEV